MLNITQAESAILAGRARWLRWLAKFTETWNEPVMNAVVLRWWDTMTPEIKAAAREQFPDQFAEIERKIDAVRDLDGDERNIEQRIPEPAGAQRSGLPTADPRLER